MAGDYKEEIYNIGQRIRKARLRKGMSQTELALAMDSKKATISNWENGEKFIRIDNLIRLSKALDVPVSALVEDPDDHKDMTEMDRIWQGFRMVPESRRDVVLEAVQMMIDGAARKLP